MTEISSAAQAVYKAFWKDTVYVENIDEHNLANALRAAANVKDIDRLRLLVIAEELDSHEFDL